MKPIIDSVTLHLCITTLTHILSPLPQPLLTSLVQIFNSLTPGNGTHLLKPPYWLNPTPQFFSPTVTPLSFSRKDHSSIDFSFKLVATHLKPAAVCQATERYLLHEEHCTLPHWLQVSSMFAPTFSQLMTEPPYFTKTRELSTTKSTNRPISISIPTALPPVILDEMSPCLPQTALLLGLWISSPLTFSQISLS